MGIPRTIVAVLCAVCVILAGAAAPGFAAAASTMTLNANSGPSGGGNTIVATAAGAVFGAADAVELQFAGGGGACAATYATPADVAVSGDPVRQTAGVLAVPGAGVRLVSARKLAVLIPSTVALGTDQSFATYHVCVYSGQTAGSSPLVAATTSPYGIGIAATLTGATPAVGPTQGGTTITVTGTGFPPVASLMWATLDGQPLTIGPVSADGTSFTASTPAHAAGGPLLLAVHTPGGTTTTLDSGGPALVFRYTNGIVTTPNTAQPTTAGSTVDIVGTGFATLSFTATTGQTPDDPGAHVYLAPGTYDPADTGSGTKTAAEKAECTGVLVLSDTELLCTLDLAHRLTSGAWTVATARTVTDAVTVNGSTTITSGSANFGPADVNLIVSGSGITAGTTIASVTDDADAELSGPATVDATSVSLAIGPRTFSDARIDAGVTTLSSPSGAFTADDVGRLVTGTGIPADTTVASVTDGSTVELSRPATLTRTGTATLGIPAQVADGAYSVTVVSDGGVDVQPGGANADPHYVQSVVSSGSAFTVAAF
jgi:hypothetical protein